MNRNVGVDKPSRFEEMNAWKKARELTRAVYAISAKSRLAQEFDLKRQMCRSAVSVAANIAEGFERQGNREFLRFLSIAKGSCGELRSHVVISRDQGFVSEEQFLFLHRRSIELSRVLAGLMKKLRRELDNK